MLKSLCQRVFGMLARLTEFKKFHFCVSNLLNNCSAQNVVIVNPNFNGGGEETKCWLFLDRPSF